MLLANIKLVGKLGNEVNQLTVAVIFPCSEDRKPGLRKKSAAYVARSSLIKGTPWLHVDRFLKSFSSAIFHILKHLKLA